MNLLEVGALLKRERERRGISIRDVMDVTKISRRNLTAIEDGQVKSLPHPVYLKGYVRNIAKMVGLDADELAQVVELQYDADQGKYLPQAASAAVVASQPVPVALAAIASEPVESTPPAQPQVPVSQPQASAPEAEAWKYHAPEPLVPPKPKSRGTLFSVLTLILLVGALIALLVQYQRMYVEAPPAPAPVLVALPLDNATNATDQENATEANAFDNATVELAQPGPASVAATAALPVPEVPRGVTPTALLPGAQATAPSSLSSISVEVARKPPVAETRTPGAQQLTITGKGREICWVGVYEGEKATTFTLRDGESRQVEFVKRARVRLGNAGGVLIRLNGQDYPFEGDRGQKVTLEFGTR